MKFKLKQGVVIMIFGVSGLVYVLANQSVGFISKIVITIFCIGVIAFGALLESPVFGYLREGEEHMEESFNDLDQ